MDRARVEAAPRERMAIRLHGEPGRRGLVYLPGLHGDWTLVGDFRRALAGAVQFAEFTYPRSTTASLMDQAAEVDEALEEAGLSGGWLLAESFGSQLAWAFLAQPRRFEVQGLVLAGGFVQHPWMGGVSLSRRILARAPSRAMTFGFRIFTWLVRLRAGSSAAARAELEEFVARRTEPDRQAALRRLDFILDHDWRTVARATRIPVHYLTGLIDPIVPWPPVHRWLRMNCPGYRGWRLLCTSDHHVLGCAPRAAVSQVLAWMAQAERP